MSVDTKCGRIAEREKKKQSGGMYNEGGPKEEITGLESMKQWQGGRQNEKKNWTKKEIMWKDGHKEKAKCCLCTHWRVGEKVSRKQKCALQNVKK